MRALRLEMLADSPLAYLETLAQAAAHSHEDYRARIVQVASGGAVAQFVAETNGRLIGHAGGAAAPDDPSRTVLYAVYVTPAMRGIGVLAGLVDAVAMWSLEAGREELQLEVVTGNRRAVRAYERLGFVDTGVRSPHPAIPGLTELEMRRRAEPAS